MLKKLTSTFFLLFFVVSLSAYGQLKIGYVNSDEVLSQMPERSEIEQKLNSFIQEKRQELQQRTMAFQDSVTAFQENQDNLSDSQIQQEEQKLSEMQASMQQYQQGIQQQISQRRAELLEPLYEKIDQAISSVAEGEDLDFVLNKATSAGENIIYYSASERLDITDQVLEYIK